MSIVVTPTVTSWVVFGHVNSTVNVIFPALSHASTRLEILTNGGPPE